MLVSMVDKLFDEFLIHFGMEILSCSLDTFDFYPKIKRNEPITYVISITSL